MLEIIWNNFLEFSVNKDFLWTPARLECNILIYKVQARLLPITKINSSLFPLPILITKIDPTTTLRNYILYFFWYTVNSY